MSYLGSIGHLMDGSGLQQVMEKVYAPNSVTHIMSGKAYSRSVRAHLLVMAALHAVLLSMAFEMPWLPFQHHPPPQQYEDEDDVDEFQEDASLSDEEEFSVEANVIGSDVLCDKKSVEEDAVNMEDVTGFLDIELEEVDCSSDLDHVAALLGRLLKDKIDAKEAAADPAVGRIVDKVQTLKEACKSRTSKLWLLYIEMVGLLQTTIKAERTGNFQLHLSAVSMMLPFFAASGHRLYAKSARLYLQ
ncbi:hypothetical protein V1264_023376 [Littorina saxatilis]|uniref:Uncharacterized protein n=1 Tax=Littorina saxatilis TaxID=31220 RepID=A0AAN9B881_9CAEN